VSQVADGADCAYLSGVVVHPEHQGKGPGKEVIRRLVEAAADHKKAIWRDPAAAVASGLLRAAQD
jgi:GNAT superfamily N-acetyltransferase